MANQTELHNYIPCGWQLIPFSGGVQLIAPSLKEADSFMEGQLRKLRASAQSLGGVIELRGLDSSYSLKVRAADLNVPVSYVNSIEDPEDESPYVSAQGSISSASSYGASRLSPFAEYEAIEDFIRGQRAEGKIVTVMSMGSDKFLKVNDLQIQERAGGWTMDDWVGTDAKKLWIRSLRGTLPGRVNYYQQLIDLVTTDHYIPEFRYLINRPNGETWEDLTTYHFAEDYGGVTVRIAVSTPGQSQLVEV